MISLTPRVDIYLCIAPADMRRSFDGLMRMAEEHIRKNVLNGGLYVFINRRRDRVKLLWWDEDGLCIWYKRLEKGTYELPGVDEDATSLCLSSTQLSLILGGIELRSAKARKRYCHPM